MNAGLDLGLLFWLLKNFKQPQMPPAGNGYQGLINGQMPNYTNPNQMPHQFKYPQTLGVRG